MFKFKRGELVKLKFTIATYKRYEDSFPWKITGISNLNGTTKVVYRVMTNVNNVFTGIPEEDLEKYRR